MKVGAHLVVDHRRLAVGVGGLACMAVTVRRPEWGSVVPAVQPLLAAFGAEGQTPWTP